MKFAQNKTLGLFLLAGLAALAFGIATQQIGNNFLQNLGFSKPATSPEFSLPDVDGKIHLSQEWQGKIKVINFWATWCLPCRQELPELIALQHELATAGVVVIGVALDRGQAVKTFTEKLAINYPILIAGEENGAQLAYAFGNTFNVVPFTFIVDQNERIVFTHLGELNRQTLLTVILPLLKA